MRKLIIGFVLVGVAVWLAFYFGCWMCFLAPLKYLAECFKETIFDTFGTFAALIKICLGFPLALAGAFVFLVSGKTLIEER